MDVAQLDLPALYGRWLYAVPARNAPTPEAIVPAEEPQAVVIEAPKVPLAEPAKPTIPELQFDKQEALLAAVVPVGVLSDAQLAELYHNILSKALNLTLEQVTLAQPGGMGPWAWPVLQVRVVVQFGQVPGLAPPPAGAYVLPSLADMQNNVALKRQAWETMKQFKRLLTHA